MITVEFRRLQTEAHLEMGCRSGCLLKHRHMWVSLHYRSPQNSHSRSFQQPCIATAVSAAFALFSASSISLPCIVLMGVRVVDWLTWQHDRFLSCSGAPVPLRCSPGDHCWCSPAVPGMGGSQGRERLHCCREGTGQKLPAEGHKLGADCPSFSSLDEQDLASLLC